MKIALLSSYTVDLLKDPLVSKLEGLYGIKDVEVYVPGFNQYVQEILDQRSGLYRFEPEYVVLLVDFEDVFPNARNLTAVRGEADRIAREGFSAFDGLLSALRDRLPKTIVLFPALVPSPFVSVQGLEYNSAFSVKDLANGFNQLLKKTSLDHSNFHAVDFSDLVLETGYDQWFDARLWYLAKIRQTNRAAERLAERLASYVAATLGLMKKCIVLDLDNVLWGGLAGEDGLSGIVLDEGSLGQAFVDFQNELVSLAENGTLLAVSSKNTEELALSVIDRHPSMRLKRGHFSSIRINWRNKSENIVEIAKELNIGLNSLVFLDDSPQEREEVRRLLPEVTVPEMPVEFTDYSAFLKRLEWTYFNRLYLTEEDRAKTAQYKAQVQRRTLEQESASLEEFYHSLGMKARVGDLAHDRFYLNRVSQLTQKTNQFNLTTRRYTPGEIEALLADSGARVYFLQLEDKFGDYGVVGVLILKRDKPPAKQWLIDTFLLSCRVIGKKVENAFLGFALKRVDFDRVIGAYRPTPKNGIVAGLYPELGFVKLAEAPEGETRFGLDKGRALEEPAWIEVSEGSDHAGG